VKAADVGFEYRPLAYRILGTANWALLLAACLAARLGRRR